MDVRDKTKGQDQDQELEIGLDITALLGDDEIVAELCFDEDAGVYVEIAYVSREEIQAMRKKATSLVADKRSHQMVEKVDPEKSDNLLSDAAVRGYRGLNLGGKPFPYSKENARKLMRKWDKWAAFINANCDNLERLVAASKEKDRKN